MKIKVSVIVLNFNTWETTTNCVNSILENTKKAAFEIILIDNGSKDNSHKRLSEKFSKNSKVKLVKNDTNLGFSKGNNLGMEISKGEYILLLNSDTLIEDDVVSEMAEWMDKNKKVGIATCALKNEDGSVQGTGGYFPNLIRVISWMTIEDIPGVDKLIKPFHPQHSKSFLKNNSFYEKMQNVDWVTGAYLFVRKKVYEQIGGLDEDYFMYTEDTDFCFRAKKFGWEVVYLPNWKITHLGGKSSNSQFPILSEFKNIKLFFKKHYPSWQLPLVRFFLKIGAFGRMCLFGIIYGKEAFNTYAKALREA